MLSFYFSVCPCQFLPASWWPLVWWSPWNCCSLKQLWSWVSLHWWSWDSRSSGCAWGKKGPGCSFPAAGHCPLIITVLWMLWGMGDCCILLETCNWNNNRIKGSFIVKRLWSCIMWFHIFSFKISAFQTSLWFYSVPLTLWYYTGVYFTWQFSGIWIMLSGNK